MSKIFYTEKDKEEFITWVSFLKAGVFKKGKNKLQSAPNKYCCLGVACVLTIPEDELYVSDGHLRGGLPGKQKSPHWLKMIDEDFEKRTGLHLSMRNDGILCREWSHSKIADELIKVYGPEL